jgi:succinyl-CoA synthetase beta subunit
MERMYMRREMYLSIMMDRASQGPVIVACASGGTSIEDLAEESPELILKERIDINKGLTAEQAEKIALHLQLAPGTPVFKSVSFCCIDIEVFRYRNVQISKCLELQAAVRCADMNSIVCTLMSSMCGVVAVE